MKRKIRIVCGTSLVLLYLGAGATCAEYLTQQKEENRETLKPRANRVDSREVYQETERWSVCR